MLSPHNRKPERGFEYPRGPILPIFVTIGVLDHGRCRLTSGNILPTTIRASKPAKLTRHISESRRGITFVKSVCQEVVEFDWGRMYRVKVKVLLTPRGLALL